jgi:hypothetical protein
VVPAKGRPRLLVPAQGRPGLVVSLTCTTLNCNQFCC